MNNVVSSEKHPIKIWASIIEEGALQQARDLANLPFLYKWVALMPDAHWGFGMPIGGVIATKGVIIPNAVGVDIGCGMIAVKTSLKSISVETIKTIIGQTRGLIPTGRYHQPYDQDWDGFDLVPDIEILKSNIPSARKQLGTLGGGNHFIEIQQSEDGFIWLMIHSGSRNLGYGIANYFHKEAVKLNEKWFSEVKNKDLAFLPINSKEGHDYFNAMKFCLTFAQKNRELMMSNFMGMVERNTDATKIEEINIHHNYAAFEHHYGENVIIHRKGATRARLGELGIIPGSMGTSSYIVEGLGNPESFTSCSHGAGRMMGRRQAQRTLDLAHEQELMEGIVHGLRSKSNLEEAPSAYKDIDVVMEDQKDLVKIVSKLKPIGNMKG